MGDATSHTKKDAQTLQDISISRHASLESRMRVYPRTAGAVVQLDPDAAADTWGDWTEVIPAGTVNFPFHIVGVLAENQEGADTWMGQFASSTTPTGSEYLGEWRIKLDGLANFFPTNFIPLQGLGIPARSPIYARVMSAAGGNWVEISVTLTRHFILKSVPPWPNWPW